MAAARKLFLIGPMGAGKTTVGKRLAQVLGLPFYDADQELERRTGVDIPYIFEKEGEAGFREREAQLIEELTRLPQLVLATGGGVVLRPENRAALGSRGCVIYLHAPVAQQVVRTAQSGKRPLLETGEPRAAILSRLFAQREPLYRATAEVVIDTTGQNARKITDQILAALARPAEKRMRCLTVELGSRSYPIHIGPGLLGDPAHHAPWRQRPRVLVTDERVALHYLERVRAAAQLSPDDCLILPAGEGSKTWAQAERVLDAWLECRLPRDGVVYALGGGVIGDLAGFCAALYQRGIDFVQLPTTLLAQVDSSVGGKTAVNHPRGKNLIGAFHQPVAVLADTDTLATLPPRELRAGLAEVIKYALLGDAAFLDWLEEHLDALLALEPAATAQTIEHCCRMKAAIVGQDEREAVSGGVRALLNLGHTFGHAIEAYTGYRDWLHGEAVATGLLLAADCSARLGWLSSEDLARVRRLLERAGLPVVPPAGMTAADFIERMALDKKVAGGRLRLVLLRRLGEAVFTADFDPSALHATLAEATA